MHFEQAKKSHHAVGVAAKADAAKATELWNTLAGYAEPAPGSYAEAARDTMTDESATLLGSSHVIVAYAFAQHWRAIRSGEWQSPIVLRDTARAAWQAVQDRAATAGTLARGFGCDLAEAFDVAGDVDTNPDLARRVAEIAKLAGRMYAALRGARASRVAEVPEEVHSVEQGNCIPRLLPTELAQLCEPELETPVLLRLVERSALQYEVRGTGERSKGPLVLALDESGSMHEQRRRWSKSAAIALARVAFDEKRLVSVVHYSTSIVERELKPGDARGLLELIRSFLGGGTLIGCALERAQETVERLAKRGQKGADVVLVTDGVDSDVAAQDRAVRRLTEQATRLWTVAIDCPIEAESPLRKNAAGYVEVNDRQLDDPKTVLAAGKAA